jgi:hypothetical protein
MTVDDNRPDTKPPAADPLTEDQSRYVDQGRALADAGDAGRETLAALVGSSGSDAAVVYAAGFGAARVMLRNLLDIVDELAEALRVHDEDDGTEPWCTTCGECIGHFLGMEGWRHFRGDPSPGGHRKLYEADHEAAPAWCVPPGRALSPGEMTDARQALADAIAYRSGAARCEDCAAAAPEACAGHRGEAAVAARYERLLRRLVTGEAVQR